MCSVPTKRTPRYASFQRKVWVLRSGGKRGHELHEAPDGQPVGDENKNKNEAKTDRKDG